GHAAGAPVGGGLGLFFQGLGDDLLDHGIGDRARGAGPGFVGQPFGTVFDEPAPPLADSDSVDAEPASDLVVIQALGGGQDDAGAGGESLSALGPAGPGFQLLSFVVTEAERSFGAAALVHRSSP